MLGYLGVARAVFTDNIGNKLPVIYLRAASLTTGKNCHQ
jgi:hypothetical protein